MHCEDLNRMRAFLRRAAGMVLAHVLGREPGPAVRQVLIADLLERTNRMAKVGSAIIINQVVSFLLHPCWKSRDSQPLRP